MSITLAPKETESTSSDSKETKQEEAGLATQLNTPNSLENAQMEIERGRIELERQKLELERAKNELSQRFWNKNSGTLITALVSLAAVLVSLGQVWSTKISKDKELEIYNMQKKLELDKLQEQKEKEMAMLNSQKQRELDLSVAQFVMANRKALFNGTLDEQKLFAKIIPTLFPPDVSTSLLSRLETASPPERKETWRKAKESTIESQRGIRGIIDKYEKELDRLVPLQNVEVSAEAGTSRYVAYTDKWGSFIINAPPGSYDVFYEWQGSRVKIVNCIVNEEKIGVGCFRAVIVNLNDIPFQDSKQ